MDIGLVGGSRGEAGFRIPEGELSNTQRCAEPGRGVGAGTRPR